MRAADVRGAEQVAVGIGDQAAHWIQAIGAVGQHAETGQDAGGTGVASGGLGDLEHRTTTISAIIEPAMPATSESRAEEVAVGVGEQVAHRKLAVGAVGQRAEAD
jgi:hypothetical protein